MLNQDTKRKIDSARDILVGKVPDPKAQVEQITTALIYKFMDDMDKDSQEIGGKAKFFINGFEKYAWTKLMDPKLGGNERLNLYLESITQLSLNPHIPQLFRDIFKDAFLPYRSPETLGLFLKEINGFTYGDSENLGDAFEYLLSILGSQGEAGQFRTPRHIIDFIVAAIDPKKGDTICDPACGTAGFLISAYKHILKQHDGLDDPENKEKPLTPDERKTLMDHFVGYDISPDMVRLSKVNMYLHGFSNPTIYEYDTLSSEERWDESFDVMLANPPFMTPRGGIRPHRRFGVQANRSEVLFVDYILEHLRPNGRAGIIVPEGIIFQSANAYKALRKLLIEDGLLAVISLPAGVFNPYAGVKTSILIFDKALAKRTKHVLFIKIQSDGLDLGAQRRPVVANDLPLALEALTGYRKFLTSGGIPDESGWPGIAEVDTNPLCQFVSKEEISKTGDYNLSGDRYKESDHFTNQKWPMVELGKIAEYINGYPFKPIEWKSTGKKIIRIQNLTGTSDVYNNTDKTNIPERYLVKRGDLLISWSATIGFYFWNDEDAYLNQHIFKVVPTNRVLKGYLYILKDRIIEEIIDKVHGNTMQHITKSLFDNIKIPLPPIEVQRKIVDEIENYQKIIDLALEMTQVKGINISIDPSWKKVSLDNLASIRYGYTTSANDEGDARFIRITDINEYGELNPNNQKFIGLNKESKKYLLKKNDVLVARTGATFGKTMIFTENYPAVFASYLICLQFDESKILPEYYWCFAQTKDYWDQANSLVTGGGQPQFNGNVLKNVQVPLPPLDRQRSIAEEFLKIRNQLVNQNLELIEIFRGKIKQILEDI